MQLAANRVGGHADADQVVALEHLDRFSARHHFGTYHNPVQAERVLDVEAHAFVVFFAEFEHDVMRQVSADHIRAELARGSLGCNDVVHVRQAVAQRLEEHLAVGLANDFLASGPDREDHGKAGHRDPFGAEIQSFKGQGGGIDAKGGVADEQGGVGLPQHFGEIGGMRENLRPDAELLGQDHLTQHGRGPRAGVRCQRADFLERNFRDQQDATHGAVAGDASAGEIVETLASHLDHRNDPDIGLA